MSKRNWFETLSEALESENLIDFWECTWPPIAYGENRRWNVELDSKHGKHISIYRDENGRYERPIHYGINLRLSKKSC